MTQCIAERGALGAAAAGLDLCSLGKAGKIHGFGDSGGLGAINLDGEGVAFKVDTLAVELGTADVRKRHRARSGDFVGAAG